MLVAKTVLVAFLLISTSVPGHAHILRHFFQSMGKRPAIRVATTADAVAVRRTALSAAEREATALANHALVSRSVAGPVAPAAATSTTRDLLLKAKTVRTADDLAVTTLRAVKPGSVVSSANMAMGSITVPGALAASQASLRSIAFGMAPGGIANQVGFALYKTEQQIGQSLALQRKAKSLRLFQARQRLLTQLRNRRQFLLRQERIELTLERTATSSKLRKLQPDFEAQGPHTTWKLNSEGEIVRHETWTPNPRNPTGWDSVQSTDLEGSPHRNTKGELIPTPHTMGRNIRGGVRPALPSEILGSVKE
jgi:hypothetical protein